MTRGAVLKLQTQPEIRSDRDRQKQGERSNKHGLRKNSGRLFCCLVVAVVVAVVVVVVESKESRTTNGGGQGQGQGRVRIGSGSGRGIKLFYSRGVVSEEEDSERDLLFVFFSSSRRLFFRSSLLAVVDCLSSPHGGPMRRRRREEESLVPRVYCVIYACSNRGDWPARVHKAPYTHQGRMARAHWPPDVTRFRSRKANTYHTSSPSGACAQVVIRTPCSTQCTLHSTKCTVVSTPLHPPTAPLSSGDGELPLRGVEL